MAELPERLREMAGAHRPDRERMLARVERGMAAPDLGRKHGHEHGATGPRRDRPPAPWMRVTAVAAAVAGAIGLGGLALGALSGGGSPGQSVVTSGGTSPSQPPPAASGTSGPGTAHSALAPHRGKARRGHRSPGSGHGRGGSTASPGSTPPSAATAPTGNGGSGDNGAANGGRPAAPPAGGGLTSAGSLDPHSNAYWTESDVKLTNARSLTSLSVTLRIARTDGVGDNSSFTSAPGTTAAVSVEGGYLVYRWTLDSGHTLAPGSYTFAGQFNHSDSARDTGGDSYTVTVNGTDGQATAHGGF
jgi:hypothetical protein